MTPGEWVGLVVSVVLGGISVWKALQAKDYKGALNATVDGVRDAAQKMKDGGDPRAAKALKAAVTVRAVAAGIEPFLNTVVEERKKEVASSAPAATILLLPLLLLPALAGCQATKAAVEPYRLSVKGMVDTGNEVRPLIKKDLDPSEQALVDAWDFQRGAGQKLVDAK